MSDDIEAMVKATIQTKIIEAFNSTPEMIEKLVQAALNKEVTENGLKPDHYDRTKMPYLEFLVGEEIRRAAQSIVREYVADHQEVIREKVSEAVKGGDFSSPIIKFFERAMQDEWRWGFDITVQKDK